MDKEDIFISFSFKTDETVRFSSRTESRNADKELFRLNGFFFWYVFNRSDKTSTYSLREITEDEFNARKQELLKLRPKGSRICEWQDGESKIFVRDFKNGFWKRKVPATDCIFLTENNPVKKVYDATLAREKEEMAETTAAEEKVKYEYAKKCGGLGRKLGIEYVNVLRIGPEKGKLMRFKETYQTALARAEKMSLEEKFQLYGDLFRRGRTCRKNAMDKLGIEYGSADVNLLSLPELEKVLHAPLESYVEKSAQEAEANAAKADHETRARLYKELMGSNRGRKKKALAELGVNVQVINVSKFPCSKIKKTLAATLGIETEA